MLLLDLISEPCGFWTPWTNGREVGTEDRVLN